jgi:hypothetical protein
MLLNFNKDYIFQNILCFTFLLIVISKLNITLKHIYSFIIVVILWYSFYYFTNENNKIQLEKRNYIKKFIEGKNYFDNHNKFINFIYENQRFESSKNFTELINSINTFLKYCSELNTHFEVRKIENCKDLYKNAMNSYQSLIYLLSTIDDNYQDNISKLQNIFNIYFDTLKNIEKDEYNENNINNSSKPYEEIIIEGKDKIDTFNVF